jgi:hypothetical protein
MSCGILFPVRHTEEDTYQNYSLKSRVSYLTIFSGKQFVSGMRSKQFQPKPYKIYS